MAETDEQVVCLGIGTGDAPRGVPAREIGTGLNGHVLRVALALRGGVSLAVWIGGAVAELDVARRVRICRTANGWDAFYLPPSDTAIPALSDPEISRARVYARLLAQAGFDAIELDVLAGASAGGLNAVVYAVAQRAGASVNSLLETWQDAADIRNLLQPPGFGRVDSLLRGDYYFWPRVTRALHALYDRAVTPRNARHSTSAISIDLAATIIDSADRSVPGARDTRGYFHFVGSRDSPEDERGRGIPHEPADGSDLARLAYAARSTSSYPGAFEPALIFSTTKMSADAPVGDATHLDMSYAFSGHRPTWNHPFRVIDGSITDEVPIAQAFKSARRAPSSTRSSRLVLYLDPSPPAPSPRTIRPTRYGPPDPARGPLDALKRYADRQSRVLNVLRAGGNSANGIEPGSDEVAHIERFRLGLMREKARGDAYAAAQSDAAFHPEDARRAYVRSRAASDVQLLSAVTADPAAWQNSANIRTRSIWPAWDATDREDLQHVAEARYTADADPERISTVVDAVTSGPQALVDAALSGLAWVRTLERLPAPASAASTAHAAIRHRLYAVLRTAIDARDAVIAVVLDAARATAAPASHAIEVWLTEQAAAPHPELWGDLDAVLRDLVAASPTDDADSVWAHSPFSVFPRTGATARDLAPFLAPRGIPDSISALSFARLTADEPPAHPEQYTALARRHFRRRTRIALGLAPADITDETMSRLFSGHSLGADDKLSGSLVFNFGGFLSRQWRANDWWWGRLDAAAGLVRVLGERAAEQPKAQHPGTAMPDTAPAQNVPTETAQADADATTPVDAVQTALLHEMAASADPPLAGEVATNDSASIRREFQLGADTLDNLAPTYRLAMASRSIRVASRALASSLGPVGRALVAVARPFAVALPAAFTPLRAAALGAAIGLAAVVVASVDPGIRPTGIALTWPAHLVAAVIIIAGVGSSIDAQRRWRRVLTRLHHVAHPLPAPVLTDVSELRHRARVQNLVLTALAVLATVTASAIVQLRGLDVSWWILVASAAVILAHGRSRALDPSPSLIPARLYALGTAAFLLWAAVVTALPAELPELHLDHRAVTPLTTLFAGIACALLLTTGWLSWAPTIRGILANPVVTSVCAGIAGAAPVWVATHIAGAPFPALTTTSTAIVAVMLWGSALWWIPEIPSGSRDRIAAADTRQQTAP